MGMPAARLGGEEVALLIEARLPEAMDIAEHFRRSVGELSIRAEEHTIAVTCSGGVAEWRPGDTIDTLLRRADTALYEAKHAGRNRIIAADRSVLSAAEA
jgi:two-component system, cell cycle response regulator